MAVLTPATNIDPSPAVGGGDITLVGGSALLAQEGPSGTAADIENQPVSAQISVYTVREGGALFCMCPLSLFVVFHTHTN